jgi:purine nucleoside permease
VLALGRGAGGEAALLAVQQRAGTQYLGLHGPRFAANACLDAGCEWSVSTSETPEGWPAGALSAGTALAAGGPLASDQL